MTELMRPALYGSFHRIVPVSPRASDERPWDIVGPICESSDVFARDRSLPELRVDDLVAVLDTGAYGAVMASNYNRRFLALRKCSSTTTGGMSFVDAKRWTMSLRSNSELEHEPASRNRERGTA